MNRLVSVVVGVAGMAFVASADLIKVDFTDDAFSGADGETSFTSEEHGITLTAYPEEPWAATLTQSDKGIGIFYIDASFNNSYYEVDGDEVLTIDFGRDVNLESVYISNLDKGSERFWIFEYTWCESGIYQTSSENKVQFNSENENGELTLDISETVSSIRFYAEDGGLFSIDDFSVRGVSYTSIPEPATSVPEPAMLSLLGASLLGLGFVRSRKK